MHLFHGRQLLHMLLLLDSQLRFVLAAQSVLLLTMCRLEFRHFGLMRLVQLRHLGRMRLLHGCHLLRMFLLQTRNL